MRNQTGTMRAVLWKYQAAQGSWHFITLPRAVARSISERAKGMRRGWGSLPVTATIGATAFRTSIFPDRKSGSFVLPVKASVRKAEGIADGDMVTVSLTVELGA